MKFKSIALSFGIFFFNEIVCFKDPAGLKNLQKIVLGSLVNFANNTTHDEQKLSVLAAFEKLKKKMGLSRDANMQISHVYDEPMLRKLQKIVIKSKIVTGSLMNFANNTTHDEQKFSVLAAFEILKEKMGLSKDTNLLILGPYFDDYSVTSSYLYWLKTVIFVGYKESFEVCMFVLVHELEHSLQHDRVGKEFFEQDIGIEVHARFEKEADLKAMSFLCDSCRKKVVDFVCKEFYGKKLRPSYYFTKEEFIAHAAQTKSNFCLCCTVLEKNANCLIEKLSSENIDGNSYIYYR